MERIGLGMTKLFSLLALVLVVAVARAANPSFSAFDANFFQVSGTGNNSIKIKTNAFTWMNAGGTQVWTNNAGVIQPVSTNAVTIQPDGSVWVGGNNNLFSKGFSARGTNEQQVGLDLASTLSGTNASQLTLFTYADDSVYRQAGLDLQAGLNGSGFNQSISFSAAEDEIRIRGRLLGSTVFELHPMAADGTTPYTWDTSVQHTSGNLLELRNVGGITAKITAKGGMTVGNTNAGFGIGTISAQQDGAIAFGVAEDNGAIQTGSRGALVSGSSSGTDSTVLADGEGSVASGYALGGGRIQSVGLGSSAVGYSADTSTISASGHGSSVFGAAVNAGSIVASGLGSFAGGVGDAAAVVAGGEAGFTYGKNIDNSGANAFAFGSNFTNATANTFNVGWGAAHFIVNPTNGVSTPLITAYGAVAQPWQLGSASNVTSVAFPGFTATNIIEVAINGVAYYIPAKIK